MGQKVRRFFALSFRRIEGGFQAVLAEQLLLRVQGLCHAVGVKGQRVAGSKLQFPAGEFHALQTRQDEA